jgi:hypothetical protein
LAGAIYHAMLGRVPLFDRGMKRARFAVLRRAVTPAVLVECGFVTNPRDARLLNDAKWRARLADSIARGIIEFCNLTRAKKAPKLLAAYRKQEAAALAGTEFEYRPLAGIGAALQTGAGDARGWRVLLPVPLGEEMVPFKLEFEPPGLAQLEAWAAAGEDARSMSHDEQSGMVEQSEWPSLAPSFGLLRGWRELLPPHGLDRGFELCPSAAGPVQQNAPSVLQDSAIEVPEIGGGRL